MKITRVFSVLLCLLMLFALAASAADLVPSIERRPGVELVEKPEQTEKPADPAQPEDELIVTNLSEIQHIDVHVHEDIKESLAEAHGELSDTAWEELLLDFEELWEEASNGAPVTNAVISDVFDARYLSELGNDEGKGKDAEFSITLQDLTKNDTFFIIMEQEGKHHWTPVAFTIDDNNVITIKGTSKAAYAIIRDSGDMPSGDPTDPNSPQTGVNTFVLPVVIGVLVLGLFAAYILRSRKLSAK